MAPKCRRCGIPFRVFAVVSEVELGGLSERCRRRGVLAAASSRRLGATRGFGVSKPTISEHLKVLEREGVVVRSVVGRTHQLRLHPEALGDAAEWFDRQQVVWGRMFDAVDDLLAERKDTR